jgi:hypothetical protein
MARDEWVGRLYRQESGLGNLLMAYFNEDWRDISGETWQDVVADFATHQSGDDRQSALTELDELLSDGVSEPDIDWLLHRGVHASVNSDRFGYPTWTAWLEAVRDELRRLC